MSEYAQLRGGAADASVEVDALSETEIATWSESQVRDWVASIPKCKRYAALFQEHEIEGSVLLGLTDTHLKEIGVDRERSPPHTHTLTHREPLLSADCWRWWRQWWAPAPSCCRS